MLEDDALVAVLAVVFDDDVLVAVPASLDAPVLVEDEVVPVSIGSVPESMTVPGFVTSELVLDVAVEELLLGVVLDEALATSLLDVSWNREEKLLEVDTI